jgi:hypothetical protein
MVRRAGPGKDSDDAGVLSTILESLNHWAPTGVMALGEVIEALPLKSLTPKFTPVAVTVVRFAISSEVGRADVIRGLTSRNTTKPTNPARVRLVNRSCSKLIKLSAEFESREANTSPDLVFRMAFRAPGEYETSYGERWP